MSPRGMNRRRELKDRRRGERKWERKAVVVARLSRGGGRGAFPAVAEPGVSLLPPLPFPVPNLLRLPLLCRGAQQFTLNYFIKHWKVEEEELNVLLKGGSCS